jgi:hypothetical protein
MKRRRAREQDEAIGKEQAERRRAGLLDRLRAQEAAAREAAKPRPATTSDQQTGEERPPDTEAS